MPMMGLNFVVNSILILSFLVVVAQSLQFTLERVIPLNKQVNVNSLIAWDRARHHQMLQQGGHAHSIVQYPLSGSSINGLYYTKIELGTPSQNLTVQIDTGSDVLWVTCSTCINCPRSSDLGIVLDSFDIERSSTVSHLSCSDKACPQTATRCPASSQCSYRLEYVDGSGTSGNYLNDQLSLNLSSGNGLTHLSVPVVFGCSTYQYGTLKNTTMALDGILGLGPGDLSVRGQLSSQGITPDAFSHCLKGEGAGGGVLVFGEIVAPNKVYSPIDTGYGFYNLNLERIAVNGQVLSINPAIFSTSINQGTLVDSGTTLIYLVSEAYYPVHKLIIAAAPPSLTPFPYGGLWCYQISTSLNEIFPSISLNFAGGANLILMAEDYFIRPIDFANLWCLGILKSDTGITILGDLAMQDRVFVYDLAQQRLGWADYNCSSDVQVNLTIDQNNNGRAHRANGSSKRKWSLILHIAVFIHLLLL